MAGLTSLVTVIAESFALEIPTVREYARVLRNSGLLTKQRAGRSGGIVSVGDAVNLLLAVAGTARPSRSNFPIEEHGACISEDAPWQLSTLALPKVKSLPADHSLADLLNALITSGIEGDVDPHTAAVQGAGRGPIAGSLSVEVVMYEPLVRTEVRIGLSSRDADGAPIQLKEEGRLYQQTFGHKGQLARPTFQAHLPSDLSHQHHFTERSLMNLAATLKGD